MHAKVLLAQQSKQLVDFNAYKKFSKINPGKIKNLKYYFAGISSIKYHAAWIQQEYEKWYLILKYIYDRKWSYTNVIVSFVPPYIMQVIKMLNYSKPESSSISWTLKQRLLTHFLFKKSV